MPRPAYPKCPICLFPHPRIGDRYANKRVMFVDHSETSSKTIANIYLGQVREDQIHITKIRFTEEHP